jgi:hypothetical protein
MRLAVVETGLRPVQKLVARVVRLLAGRLPGPIAAMSYKKELFGKALSACLLEAMRGSKSWTVGEVELFAAFVSKVNHCAY